MNDLNTVDLPECYRVLKVAPGSSWSEIKGAYYARALEYHPDRNQGKPESEEQFKKVAHAFQILSTQFDQGDAYYSYSGKFQTSGKPDPMEEFFDKESSFYDFDQEIDDLSNPRFNSRLARLSKQVWEKLKSFERLLLELDVETVITLDRDIALSGGTVNIRRGSNYTQVRVPRGVDDQSVITIEGGGDRGILNSRRGDLKIRFQFKDATPRQPDFYHVVNLARTDIEQRKCFTLETENGPIRYSLPRNAREGQQFTLYSRKDPSTGRRQRHVISIRVRPGI